MKVGVLIDATLLPPLLNLDDVLAFQVLEDVVKPVFLRLLVEVNDEINHLNCFKFCVFSNSFPIIFSSNSFFLF